MNLEKAKTNQALDTKAKAERFGNMIEMRRDELLSILPAGVTYERVKQCFILACKHQPKLLDCDLGSLMKALYTCASMGLDPDPALGQVYILPYKETAQVIPGYRGLLRLVRNTGEIKSFSAHVVRQNDLFEYELGTNPHVKHQPALSNPGEAIAYYCVATFKDGQQHVEIMGKSEVDKIKNLSSAVKGGRSTPWNEHYDEMAKKTVIRRAVKMLPMSPTRELSNLFTVDNAAYQAKPVEVDLETGEIYEIAADPWASTVDPETSSESKGLDALNEQLETAVS